jgi:hypothetical protein
MLFASGFGANRAMIATCNEDGKRNERSKVYRVRDSEGEEG